jgi:cell division septal protein FtsQ
MRYGESGTFSRARGLIQRSNRLLVALLVASFALAVVVWFVFVSGYFSLKHIQTNELHNLSQAEVEEAVYGSLEQGRWYPWDNKNLLLINRNRLAEELKNRLFAERLVVDKSYPDILRLLIEERQRSVVVVSKNQLLVIDMAGVVAGEAGEIAAQEARDALNGKIIADSRLTPLIVCDLPELVTAGYQATDQETIKSWLEAYRAFIGSGLKFRYLRLNDVASESAYLAAEDGWQVIFDLGRGLEPQIETYKKFYQNKPKDFKAQEYVDVRVPGKIFVK